MQGRFFLWKFALLKCTKRSISVVVELSLKLFQLKVILRKTIKKKKINFRVTGVRFFSLSSLFSCNLLNEDFFYCIY